MPIMGEVTLMLRQASVLEAAAGMIAVLGYGGVFLLTLLEDSILPIPSEVILPLAGFECSRFGLTLPGVILAGTLGSVVGGMFWYYVGRAVGMGHSRRGVARRLVLTGRIARARAWFDSHEGRAVLLARLLPGIRSLIGMPAGAAGMPLLPFVAYSTVGALGWTAALAWGGQALGGRFLRAIPLIGQLAWLVPFAAVAALLAWLGRSHLPMKLSRRHPDLLGRATPCWSSGPRGSTASASRADVSAPREVRRHEAGPTDLDELVDRLPGR
jgi:membrane protein DedA with SNARE-associated domain